MPPGASAAQDACGAEPAPEPGQQVAAPRLHQRQEPEDDACHQPQRRRGARRAHVECDPGQPRNAGRRHGDHQVHRPGRQREAGGGRKQRQQQALGHELPAQAPDPGAERLPHGNLAHPRRRPHQDEIGHVGARDQQHESHGDRQDRERCAHGTEHHVRERLQEHAARIVLGIRALQLPGDIRQLRARGREGRPRREPADHEDGMRRPRQGIRIRSERHPHVDVGSRTLVGEGARVRGRGENLQHSQIGVVRHDPDDRRGRLVEEQHAADYLRVAAEALGPQRLADQGDGSAAGARLLACERPPEERLDAEHRQQPGGNRQRRPPNRRPPLGRSRDLRSHERAERVHLAAALPKVEEVRDGRRLPDGAAVAIGLPHHDEAVHRLERHGSQQHPVDDAEHGGGAADSECQHQDGNDGERSLPHQEAHGEPEVVPDLLQPRAPHVPAQLLDLIEASELEAHAPARLAGGHPGADVVRHLSLDVVAELGIELALQPLGVPAAPPPAHRTPPPSVARIRPTASARRIHRAVRSCNRARPPAVSR